MSAITKRNALRCTIEGAIFIALAQVLGYLKFYRMPYGGSITLIMLPIFIFAVRWGWKSGLIAGLALGILQFMFDGGFVIGWQSILGDYVIAYTLCGLAGVTSRKPESIFLGAVIGSVARFASVWLTGATLWAEYMPDVFLETAMTSPWFYSMLYNGIYVFGSMVITLIAAALLYAPLKKYLLGGDIVKA